jgi:hypothetical protein
MLLPIPQQHFLKTYAEMEVEFQHSYTPHEMDMNSFVHFFLNLNVKISIKRRLLETQSSGGVVINCLLIGK